MTDKFFIRHILTIVLILQAIFICSCSWSRKTEPLDYESACAGNIHFLPVYDAVLYPEDSKSDFDPKWPEESQPSEAEPESPKPHSDKPDDSAEQNETVNLQTEGNPKDFSDREPERAEKKSAEVQEMNFYKHYSRKLGINLDGTENKKFIMAVAEWLGTPYQWGGCSKKGVDCSCLIKAVYEKAYGIELSRTSLSMCSRDIVPVETGRLREGDIICFGTKENDISHVGLYLKDSKFIHASLSKGVRISSLEKNYFKKRLLMAGRAVRPIEISIAKLSLRNLSVVNR